MWTKLRMLSSVVYQLVMNLRHRRHTHVPSLSTQAKCFRTVNASMQLPYGVHQSLQNPPTAALLKAWLSVHDEWSGKRAEKIKLLRTKSTGKPIRICVIHDIIIQWISCHLSCRHHPHGMTRNTAIDCILPLRFPIHNSSSVPLRTVEILLLLLS